MRILNLGILAHVDAGKTSLTERILFETGAITSVGRVDHGTTQTDTMELERQRGITIRSAVVSFRIGDLKVNLIDTPGHADFVAEVERSLLALDAVVLVVSAVEGVQAQTRKLVRVVRGHGLPMAVFINKIDRLGARPDAVLDEIREKLHLRLLPMNRVLASGTRSARTMPCDLADRNILNAALDLLSLANDDLIGAFESHPDDVPTDLVCQALKDQVATGIVAPVWFGSALIGEGVTDLLDGLQRWLPVATTTTREEPGAVVFKIQRGETGEKLVYVRIMSGSIRVRARISVSRVSSDGGTKVAEMRVTGIDRFEDGSSSTINSAHAGEIVRLHGLTDAQIGDWIGDTPRGKHRIGFTPPALESVVHLSDPSRASASSLYTALVQLAEQDPLIGVRRDDRRHEISVRLYGEVQKEVIAAVLADDYGLDVDFDPSRVICIECPVGCGYELERMEEARNPFVATVGLRVEPGPVDSGVTFHRPSGALPLAFYVAIEETVRETLHEGLRGWDVQDVVVTLTETAYASPVTTAADFRKLTPLVLMEALRKAGTRVCEPVARFELEIPSDTLGDALSALVSTRAIPESTSQEGATARIVGTIPSSLVHPFEQRLPSLTRGEGVIASEFSHYAPVTSDPPTRERTDHDPLDRKRYLAEVSQL